MAETYLVDTHSHLYSEEFAVDIAEVMTRARKEGVAKIYLPSIDSSATDAMLHLEASYPENCFAMMGLHPCYVKENYLEELELVKQWLSQRSFAAVGEIGLDYYWDRSFDQEQKEAFAIQMDLALQYSLPIVIHSRDSMDDSIKMVQSRSDAGIRGVFHCFSGTYEQAVKIIDMGFYLGIGGVLTYKKSGLAEVVEKLPMSALVLETDAPYLSPVPFRGKRNESSYLKHILSRLAEIKRLPEQEIAAVTTSNAEKLFARAES
ncbi:MAG: TatD family deoxyribonuclease [Chitinophagaceae bacterium]|nr:MAG: TatD family deoxyribonuclease [Chitinophagaceae bacterium]